MSLASKVAEIMSVVSGINKTGFNQHFRYRFVEASRVADGVRGEMAKRQLALFPKVLSHTKVGDMTTITVEYTLVDGESGERMTLVSIGEGMDKGDKGSNKCMTSALKYALIQLFLLPTGDDVEADEETDKATVAKKAPVEKKSPFTRIMDAANEAGMDGLEIAELIKSTTGKIKRDEVTEEHAAKVIAIIKKGAS